MTYEVLPLGSYFFYFIYNSQANSIHMESRSVLENILFEPNIVGTLKYLTQFQGKLVYFLFIFDIFGGAYIIYYYL